MVRVTRCGALQGHEESFESTVWQLKHGAHRGWPFWKQRHQADRDGGGRSYLFFLRGLYRCVWCEFWYSREFAVSVLGDGILWGE